MRYSRKEKIASVLQEKLPAWEKEEKDGNVRLTRGRISVEPDYNPDAQVRIFLDGKRISAIRIPESSITNMTNTIKDVAILAYSLTAPTEK